MNRILIIEDEQSIADIIAFNLKREGFEPTHATDGQSGLEAALEGDFDLVLLDVMLPVMDGFTVLKKLRETSSVPVIMVTAREEEADKILGLDNGADDYITKPFSIRELMSRVRANLRRTMGSFDRSSEKVVFGPFTIWKDMMRAEKDGKPLDLSQRELDLLMYFIRTPNRVISREELLKDVWGYDYYGDLRTVDVAMRRLREKLEDDPAQPEYIMTKRGNGYFIKE